MFRGVLLYSKTAVEQRMEALVLSDAYYLKHRTPIIVSHRDEHICARGIAHKDVVHPVASYPQ